MEWPRKNELRTGIVIASHNGNILIIYTSSPAEQVWLGGGQEAIPHTNVEVNTRQKPTFIYRSDNMYL